MNLGRSRIPGIGPEIREHPSPGEGFRMPMGIAWGGRLLPH